MVSILAPPAHSSFYPSEPVTPADYVLPPHNNPHIPYLPVGFPPHPQPSYPIVMNMFSQMPPPVANQYGSQLQPQSQPQPHPQPSSQYSAWPQTYRKHSQDSFQSFAWNQQAKPIGEQDIWAVRMLQRQSYKKFGFGNYEYGQQHQPELDMQKLSAHYDPVATVGAPEQKSGGVSAKLDYNLDVMAEFLCTMASGVMASKNPPTPAFLKFTHQILSSTRLPGSTIVLSLVYLSKRCEIQMPSPYDHTAQYHLLIVSLILANKFNDDNTFTNKSWAEVTGLPIKDLTRIESNWLKLINWKLNLCDADMIIWNKWNTLWVEFLMAPQEKSPLHNVAQQPHAVQTQQSDHWYDHHQDDSRYRSTYHNHINTNVLANLQQQYRYGELGLQPSYYPHHQQHHQHTPHQVMVSSHNAHCNCHYCVFEPIVPMWTGPAAAAC
ncbi:hypothetical protein V1509DRAFT_637316 [Lipomyces kononenkoae]